MYSSNENRGEIQNLWSMTEKKVIRNFGRKKWEFWGAKGKIEEIFHAV